MEDTLVEAGKVFEKEIAALEKTREHLGDVFVKIVDRILACNGRIIITGMGKSGHIARKIAATFASLGTPSFFVHPAEALHGDLGMITDQDIVIAVSHSGESSEIVRMIPAIKRIGADLLSITGNQDSTLARYSDIAEVLPKFDEACLLGLAPTSTTTASLVYGDALAVVVSWRKGFRSEDFGLYHPAGSLGRQLIAKVSDIMITGSDKPMVQCGAYLKDAIVELSQKRTGIVVVMDQDRIAGIITEGNLRRALEQGRDVYTMKAGEIMTKKPISIMEGKLVIDALKLLREKNISSLLVVNDGGNYTGVVTLQMVIKAL